MAAARPGPEKRYTERRKSGGKNRSRRLLAVLAAVCALLVLLRGQIFVVKEIAVAGNSFRSSSEIISLSGLNLGMSIFDVNQSDVKRNLSADNYVEVLKVEVEMPDQVRIGIRERKPCAAINSAGVILLIDQEGYILERTTSLPGYHDVIIVSGLDVSVNSKSRTIESGRTGQIALMQKLLTAIYEEKVEKVVAELNVNDPDNLYLITQTGIQILLGDEGQLSEKLVWTKAVLDELTKEGIMKGVLDVSSGKNAVYAER